MTEINTLLFRSETLLFRSVYVRVYVSTKYGIWEKIKIPKYSQIFPDEPPFEINERRLVLDDYLSTYLAYTYWLSFHNHNIHFHRFQRCREAFESRWLLPFSCLRFSGITSHHLKKTQKKLRRVSNTFSLTSLQVIRRVMLAHTLCNRQL
jgi:hypothetical protein